MVLENKKLKSQILFKRANLTVENGRIYHISALINVFMQKTKFLTFLLSFNDVKIKMMKRK